jgi:hypothetical protein
MNEFIDKIFSNFLNSVGGWEVFLLNLGVNFFLSLLTAWFYLHYGNAVSNRRRFAYNFMPLGMTTMLIMLVVKSNIALSLGLVGALSIVRFRAAIKDPEELVFLFMIIAIGLCTGSNQPLAAVVVLPLILLALFLNKKADGGAYVRSQDRLYLNIYTDVVDLPRIQHLVETHLREVQLKRLDAPNPQHLDLSYTAQWAKAPALAALQADLQALSPQTRFSLIDQPDLIV